MLIACSNPVEVTKESFWLAWQACGKPYGMGIYQDNPNAKKSDVWMCVAEKKDYPFSTEKGVKGDEAKGDAYGDYVFGRMMKLGISWESGNIKVPDSTPRPDYQSWCHKFASYADLINAAIASVKSQAAA